MKAVQVVHMIYTQVIVDMFFIDWEQPRAMKGRVLIFKLLQLFQNVATSNHLPMLRLALNLLPVLNRRGHHSNAIQNDLSNQQSREGG